LIFAACGKTTAPSEAPDDRVSIDDKNNGGEESQDTEGDDEIVNPVGVFPIVKEGHDVTITAFAALTSRVDDFENNEFTKWLTEKTNVKLKFVSAPSTDSKTKLNLLLNSGDYPDVIWGHLSAPEMALYGSQGVLIPLDEYIEKYSYYVHKVFEEYPAAKDVITSTDGKIYALPDINDCYHCKFGSGRIWVYMPFVKKLNLSIPNTTEEFYQVLKAIKEGDPNENGKPDEIPYASEHINYMRGYFMNSFMTYTNENVWIDDNGKVRACYTEEEYKEGLRYLRRLYAEGLILKETFVISNDELITIGENPEAPLIFSATAWGPEGVVKKAGPSGRWFEYLTIPPLEGPSGIRYARYTGQYNAVSPRYFITDKCQYPEVAVRLGDFLYDTEATIRAYIGPEGVSWEWSEEGTKGIHGEQALYRELVAYGTQEMNVSWDQMNHSFRSSHFRLSNEAAGADEVMEYLNTRNPDIAQKMNDYPAYNEIMKYYEMKINYEPYAYDEKHILPPLIYEDKKYEEMADLKAVIEPYVDEMFARFITGDADIDADWNKYIEELKQMGLDRMLEIMQEAYEDKYK